MTDGTTGWELSFAAALWPYDPDGAAGSWVFATVPPEVSDEIRLTSGPPRGFGSVRVQVRVGTTTWSTSVFPDAGSGGFVLPVKQAVRRAEGLELGDLVDFTVQVMEA